jgi:hypothetical protein
MNLYCAKKLKPAKPDNPASDNLVHFLIAVQTFELGTTGKSPFSVLPQLCRTPKKQGTRGKDTLYRVLHS